MERSADRDNLVLGNQALSFGPALLRIALMIREHQLDLGAAKASKSGAFCGRQVKVVSVVDDICRSFQCMSCVGADLRRWAG